MPSLVQGLGVLREECMREAGLCSHSIGPVVEHRWPVLGYGGNTQRGNVSLMAVPVPGHAWRGANESVWNTSGSGKSRAVNAQHTTLACGADAQQRKGQPWLFIGPCPVEINCAILLCSVMPP